jgi:hypothetical protein
MKLFPTLCILSLSLCVNHGATSLRGERRRLMPCNDTGDCPSQKFTCQNSTCECVPGYRGTSCTTAIDECAEDYPCADGNKTTSFCVDDFPPKRFKCGCLSPYKAVLPNQSDVMDPVPADWRPLMCIEEPVPSTDSPTVPAPTPAPVAPTPSPVDAAPSPCQGDTDCTSSGSNFGCDITTGICKCKAGFFLTGGGRCQFEDECQDGYENDCHKYATCTNLDPPALYSCECRVGYQDKFPGQNKPGTVCENVNECGVGTHDCEAQGLTCVDAVPPEKWACVDPTPAPTFSPTPRPTVMVLYA